MKNRVAIALLSGFLSCSAQTFEQGRTWYVDCANGNDASAGLSADTAWKSVEAVNYHLFQPGDTIVFRRGSACTGMLAPKGLGTAAAPIRIDAWGDGPLPQIHARTGDQAALKLFDQEYWQITHLELSGGEPYGIFISGSKGILHGIQLRDLVVHDISGEPKNKETGLVVIAAGTEQQHFDDLVIDGVTAYHTSEWAGIMVAGVAHGFPPETSRNTNVTIRNCIVHDVAGDGIVLFQVNNGVIENSAAWLTGMQDTEKIGTPNAIWTWMCRNCVVRRNEAYLTDSPGVDGGAFDIDYGNDDNVVEENYGHDTQGYCFAVFGAGWVTTNSKVLNNVCAANGLSPRLALRQGAVFLSTWNNGKIRGLEISGNRIFWNPKVATAAVVNAADFIGKGKFEKNTIHSCSPITFRGNSSLELLDNSSEPCEEQPRREIRGWCLTLHVSAAEQDHDSRGMITLIKSVEHQFPKLKVEVVAEDPHSYQVSRLPSIVLTDASGGERWRHDGFTPPGELGLALRSFIGEPQYAELLPDK